MIGLLGSPLAGVGSRIICFGSGITVVATEVGETVSVAPLVFERMLVPLPSDAVIALSTIVIGAAPLPFEVNVTLRTWIDAPDTPYGVPPTNEITPSSFE